MTVKELITVMAKEQSVMIIPNIGDCGFYRYMVKNIPPMYLKAKVTNVRSNGAETVITVIVQ